MPETVVIILLEGLFFVGVIAMLYFSRRAHEKAWRELAESTGLTYESGGFLGSPLVTGTYRGHQLTLDTFTRGTGKSRQTYTRMVLFVNNQTNAYLALYQESVFSKVGKFFGMQDVQVGDEDFDRRFIIKSRPENYVSGLLMTGDLRQKLLEARSVNIELDGRELHFEQLGFLTKQEYLRSVFDLLSDVAAAIERAGGGAGFDSSASFDPAWGGTE
jgi:hypothetical protein